MGWDAVKNIAKRLTRMTMQLSAVEGGSCGYQRTRGEPHRAILSSAIFSPC